MQVQVSSDHDLEVAREAQWLRAVEACRGRLVNRAGIDAGYPERRFFEGGQPAWRYASEELIDFFRGERRLTATEWARLSRPVRSTKLDELDDATRDEVLALRAEGCSYRLIAQLLPASGLSYGDVWRICEPAKAAAQRERVAA